MSQIQDCDIYLSTAKYVQHFQQIKKQIDSIIQNSLFKILIQEYQQLKTIKQLLVRSSFNPSLSKFKYLSERLNFFLGKSHISELETLNFLSRIIKMLDFSSFYKKDTRQSSCDKNIYLSYLANTQIQSYKNIKCLGCIERLQSQIEYNFESTNQNYIMLDVQSLSNDATVINSLCALLNSGSGFIFVVEHFSLNNRRVKINRAFKKSEIGKQSHIRTKIRQAFNYLVPHDNQPSIQIYYIPICRSPSNLIYSQEYILRINIKSHNPKSFHFTVFKDSNSQKKLQVQSYQIVQQQLNEVMTENCYNKILTNFYHKGPRFQQNPHNGIQCYRNKLSTEDNQQKNTISKTLNKKQNSQSFNKYKFSTLVALFNPKKKSLIDKIKTTFSNSKIIYDVKQIQLPKQNVKNNYLFWEVTHSCPHETSNKLLKFINNEGYLTFNIPTNNILIKDQSFFTDNKYKSFLQFTQALNLNISDYSIWNCEKGINQNSKNPVKIATKSKENSVMFYCYFLTQDIRRLQFTK